MVKLTDIMEDNEKILPQLENLKSDSGFRVPEGYFDTLSSRISDKIISQKEEKVSERSWISVLKPPLSLAALFAGVAIIGYVGFDFFTGKYSTETISNESISEFISYYYPGTNDFDLLEVANEELLMEWPEEIPNQEADEIIDYLMYQEVEINSIINEF